MSSRRLQNGGPRASKWGPGGLLGVEKASFEAKAVFEAFLEAFLRLLGPPLGPPKSTKRALKLSLKSISILALKTIWEALEKALRSTTNLRQILDEFRPPFLDQGEGPRGMRAGRKSHPGGVGRPLSQYFKHALTASGGRRIKVLRTSRRAFESLRPCGLLP